MTSRGSSVGAIPTRQTGSLQPVAIGAAVEVTKPSEPSRPMCRSGDAARRQVVTRGNVEQASKRPMWAPTRLPSGEGCHRGRSGKRLESTVPRAIRLPRAHRGIDDDMPAHGDRTEHGKPQAARARDPQPDAREGPAGLLGVAERPVVPRKPDNAGRGKGPWFKVNARRGRQPGELA